MKFSKTAIKTIIKIIPLTAIFLAPIQVSAIDVDLGIGITIGDSNSKPETAVKTSSVKHEGPPEHAPAHGYRTKHKYYYYPGSDVYFDPNRGLYFYLSGRNWEISTILPLNLKVKLGDHVSIEMDSDKPYVKHAEHKTKYPPGQMKKASNKNKVAKKDAHNNKNKNR
jgi:hypothetical protein